MDLAPSVVAARTKIDNYSAQHGITRTRAHTAHARLRAQRLTSTHAHARKCTDTPCTIETLHMDWHHDPQLLCHAGSSRWRHRVTLLARQHHACVPREHRLGTGAGGGHRVCRAVERGAEEWARWGCWYGSLYGCAHTHLHRGRTMQMCVIREGASTALSPSAASLSVGAACATHTHASTCADAV